MSDDILFFADLNHRKPLTPIELDVMDAVNDAEQFETVIFSREVVVPADAINRLVASQPSMAQINRVLSARRQ